MAALTYELYSALSSTDYNSSEHYPILLPTEIDVSVFTRPTSAQPHTLLGSPSAMPPDTTQSFRCFTFRIRFHLRPLSPFPPTHALALSELFPFPGLAALAVETNRTSSGNDGPPMAIYVTTHQHTHYLPPHHHYQGTFFLQKSSVHRAVVFP